MNRQNLFYATCLHSAFFCSPHSHRNAKGKDKAKHVVLIGLDSWGSLQLA